MEINPILIVSGVLIPITFFVLNSNKEKRKSQTDKIDKERQLCEKCEIRYKEIMDKKSNLIKEVTKISLLKTLPTDIHNAEYKEINCNNMNIFSISFSSFIEFYNEIEAFCLSFNNKMYEGEKVEEFMHEEVIENLIYLAKFQVKIYNEFVRISKDHKLKIPYTFNYYKYRQFNKFLEKHKKIEYKQIEEIRRKVSV
ncbi:hypothetical protein [Clostridium sp.]|jgi:hypothetical protein|uniref:hypothetical protein n=1 Tax=Clostridium sp. TaxID=1506 RepID=UPI003EE98E65